MEQMREDQDKWIKAFRERMEGYTEPVPEKVWSSLEKELNISPKKNMFVFWRIGVAATVMLAMISSITLFFLYSPMEGYMKKVSQTAIKPIIKENPIPHKEESSITKEIFSDVSKPLLSHVSDKSVENKKIRKEYIPLESDDLNDDEFSDLEVIQKEEELEQNVFLKDTILFKPFQEDNQRYSARRLPTYKKKTKDRWAINLAVNNSGFSDLNRSMEGPVYSEMVYQSGLSNWDSDIQIDMIEEDKINNDKSPRYVRKQIFMNASHDENMETEYNHKMPVSFGATFRYMLSERFAVETGLIYTKLATEGKIGSSENYYSDEYKLHYLGVPLKGNWIFWRNDQFVLYASAGGIVEKNVSGKRKVIDVYNGELVTNEEESFTVKPPQWSLTGALGAQVNVNEHFGIYIEPGIIHYFNDGSSITTIRKKHPTNFNFQLGFRVTY